MSSAYPWTAVRTTHAHDAAVNTTAKAPTYFTDLRLAVHVANARGIADARDDRRSNSRPKQREPLCALRPVAKRLTPHADDEYGCQTQRNNGHESGSTRADDEPPSCPLFDSIRSTVRLRQALGRRDERSARQAGPDTFAPRWVALAEQHLRVAPFRQEGPR